jgi:ceramide glucosyltransferase
LGPFFSTLFLALVLVAACVQIAGLILYWRFHFWACPPKRTNGPFPGVTLFKPCYLLEDGEALNYVTVFEQDYPGPLEVLFVAARETDPAVPLVRAFIQKYPNVDAKLVISAPREKQAWFPKIDSTYDAVKIAKHDYFIISDSDTVVNRDYVRQMVSALQEPGVSLVSTPQWDMGADTFASALKCLGNNADSAVFVLLHDTLYSDGIALGQSIGFRISEFNSLPESKWDFIYRFLAEDVAYARVFTSAGKKTVLRNIYCPVRFSGKTLKQLHSQKVRWLLNQKMASGNRYFYLAGALLAPEVPALLYCLFDGFSAFSLSILCASSALRIFIAANVERLLLGSFKITLRYFWAVPIWDLAHPYYFLRGFFKSRYYTQNRVFKVVDRCFYQEEA